MRTNGSRCVVQSSTTTSHNSTQFNSQLFTLCAPSCCWRIPFIPQPVFAQLLAGRMHTGRGGLMATSLLAHKLVLTIKRRRLVQAGALTTVSERDQLFTTGCSTKPLLSFVLSRQYRRLSIPRGLRDSPLVPSNTNSNECNVCNEHRCRFHCISKVPLVPSPSVCWYS